MHPCVVGELRCAPCATGQRATTIPWPLSTSVQVSKWFEKQRKLKREETGEAPKRGRHSGKASGGAKPAAAAAPGGDAAAAAAAEGPAAEAAAAEAAEAAQQEGDAMEVDGEAAPAQVAQQQEQQPGPAAEQAAAEAQPMATDAAAAEVPAATPGPAAVAASDATPAPQPSAAAAAAAPAATGATPAADGPSPAAGGSAGKAAGGSGKPGKTPASAAPARIVSAEEQVQLVAALEAEAAELRQQGLAAPLQPLPDAGAAPERQPFSDARLAAAVAGQRAPLSQLTAALMPLFKAPDGDMPLEEAVLRRWGLFGLWGWHAVGHCIGLARVWRFGGVTRHSCVGQWPHGGHAMCVRVCKADTPASLSACLPGQPHDNCLPRCAAASLTWRPARALGPKTVRRLLQVAPVCCILGGQCGGAPVCCILGGQCGGAPDCCVLGGQCGGAPDCCVLGGQNSDLGVCHPRQPRSMRCGRCGPAAFNGCMSILPRACRRCRAGGRPGGHQFATYYLHMEMRTATVPHQIICEP